jgi:hypothetical protein
MDSPNKNSSKSALLPQDEAKTPPPKKIKYKTKQNQKRKKETKTKINWRNREKRANSSKPKTFSREKKSNQIGEIERRNQITQSPKRFLEISQKEEEEEAEEKMRMKKEDQEQEDGCCWFRKETKRGTFLSQILMDQLDTRKSDGYFFQCGYNR